MTKIINGKRYDTETARLVGEASYRFCILEKNSIKTNRNLSTARAANTVINRNSWSGGKNYSSYNQRSQSGLKSILTETSTKHYLR